MQIYLSEDEANQIRKNQESAGYASFSSYVRSMLLTGSVTKVDFSELKLLTRELGNLNRNLNQITKAAWTTHDLREQDYQDVLQDWLKAKDLIDRYLYRIIRTDGDAYRPRAGKTSKEDDRC